MTIQAKTYLQRDIIKLHPCIEELGFTIHKICVSGRFYDIWTHAETGLTIHTCFVPKRDRKWFRWRGGWANFELSVQTDNADAINALLKRELVTCLGGRFEISEPLADTVTTPARRECDADPTQNTARIIDIIQTLLDDAAA